MALMFVIPVVGGIFTEDCSADDSGITANGLVWTFVKGVLTISGTGDMDDYANSTAAEWSSYKPFIKEAVIEPGITSIGDRALMNCYALTSVTIPDGVTTIGNRAFQNCYAWTSVIIPDGVTTIGDNAFAYCHNLSSVTIPDTVTIIGDYAFIDNHLSSVTIPDGVTIIGDNAFQYCRVLSSVTIPDTVTIIGDYAFQNCYALTSVTIPDGVTTIGANAFNNCYALKHICIEDADALTSIGSYAFDTQYSTSDSFKIYMEIISGNPGAIAEGMGSTKYSTTYSEGQYHHGTGTYSGGATWEVVDDVLTISGNGTVGNTSASLSYYRSITSVIIGTSITYIGNNAFFNCTALTSVTIPDGVTTIGDRAFQNCHAWTSVIIPDSITSIGSYAFYGCSALTSVTIPDSVDTIGVEAFNVCRALTSVTIPDSVITIGNKAFGACCALTSVTIPDSVISIGENVFNACHALTSVTIPDSITSIGSNAFKDTALTSVTVTLAEGKTSGGVLLGSGSDLGSTWKLPGQTAGQIETITIDTGQTIDLVNVEPTSGKTIVIAPNTDKAFIGPTHLTSGLVYAGDGASSFNETAAEVVFNANGGTPSTYTQIVGIGNAIGPVPITMTGYDAEWYSGSVKWNPNAPVGGYTQLTAHWTASRYAVTLDANGNGSDGVATATYDGGLSSIVNASSKGYAVEGYYLETDCATKIINANGTFVKDVAGFTDANGNWIMAGGATVFAKWTVHSESDSTANKANDANTAFMLSAFGVVAALVCIAVIVQRR